MAGGAQQLSLQALAYRCMFSVLSKVGTGAAVRRWHRLSLLGPCLKVLRNVFCIRPKVNHERNDKVKNGHNDTRAGAAVCDEKRKQSR